MSENGRNGLEVLMEPVNELVSRLLVAARLWSRGSAIDLGAVAAVRDAMLVANHRRHLARVPRYRELAVDVGVGAAADAADVRSLLISDEWFKSYDPAWLRNGFEELTTWLGTISTIQVRPIAAPDLSSWRLALRKHGVFITTSSATTGPPSLVARDEMTLAALRGGSGVRLPWRLPRGHYDALLLTPPGMGSGLQAGAAGLSADARRSRHAETGWPEFLSRASADGTPVVVYGSPSRLLGALDGMGSSVRLPPGSCIVVGGGWKGSRPGDIEELLDQAARSFGVERSRCVDTYSSAELNTVFVSCAAGRYHVPPVVEAAIVDDRMRPVTGDADGRLAVLDPMAMSYPGRLATSDHVSLRQDTCPCGLVGQTLLPPITRVLSADPRGCGVTEPAAAP